MTEFAAQVEGVLYELMADEITRSQAVDFICAIAQEQYRVALDELASR